MSEEKNQEQAAQAAEATAEEAPEQGEGPTPEALKAALAQAEAQSEQHREKWLRAEAEMANIKKRADRAREQADFELREKLVRGLLTVLDDFDLAILNLPEEISTHDWVEGVIAIRRKYLGEIEKLGVQEIDPTGEPFDPAFHEAIMQEASDEHDSGTVIQVLRKGYVLGERVVRPALVKVAE